MFVLSTAAIKTRNAAKDATDKAAGMAEDAGKAVATGKNQFLFDQLIEKLICFALYCYNN